MILAKTVKGYGMGVAGEGMNITHSQKKMGETHLKAFRDRFNIPISDDRIGAAPFYKPAADSEEIQYLHKVPANALGGFLPARRDDAAPLEVPGLDAFHSLLEGSGDKEMSTTMALVRLMTHDHPRQTDREVCRPHRAGRGAHLRHGGHVPPARDLCLVRASSTSRWTPTR